MLKKSIKIILTPVIMEEKMGVDKDKRSTGSASTLATPQKTGIVKGSGAKPASAKKKEQDAKKNREKSVRAPVATGAMGEEYKIGRERGRRRRHPAG